MQWKKEEKREKTERKEKRRGGELKRPRIQEWEIFSYQAIPLYEILKLYTNKTYRAPSLWVGRLRLRESPNLSFLRSPAQKLTPPSSLWYLQGILERAAPTTNNLFCARYCPKCFVSGSYFISQQPCVSSSASSGWETRDLERVHQLPAVLAPQAIWLLVPRCLSAQETQYWLISPEP